MPRLLFHWSQVMQWEELRSEAAFSLVAGLCSGRSQSLCGLLIGSEPQLREWKQVYSIFLILGLEKISSLLFFQMHF
jgi:hypothetical protein